MINNEKLLKNWEYENVLSSHAEEGKKVECVICKDDILDLLNNYEFDTIKDILDCIENDIGNSIFERADSDVEVYNWNLRCWIVENYNFLEDAISEGLVAVDKFDFHRAIMAAQFLMYERGYYEAMEDLKEYITDNFKV